MITVVYFDGTHNWMTSLAEYSQEHMTSRMLRDIVTSVLYDVDDAECDNARAYIFFGSDCGKVNDITGFDNTQMLIMANVVVTALRHRRDMSSKDYVADVWIHRDTDIVDYVVSKPLYNV